MSRSPQDSVAEGGGGAEETLINARLLTQKIYRKPNPLQSDAGSAPPVPSPSALALRLIATLASAALPLVLFFFLTQALCSTINGRSPAGASHSIGALAFLKSD